MSYTYDDGFDDDEVRGLDREDQRHALLTWFQARYVAPEDHRLFINHQDWLSDEDEEAPDAFANSDEEPVDALEVLTERFSHAVSNELLNDIAGKLEKTAMHWFRINDIGLSREEELREIMLRRMPTSAARNQQTAPNESNAALILTPRFPKGVPLADLRSHSTAVQKETMVAWFLATHTPATGAYVGFSGPASPQAARSLSTTSTADPNQGPSIVGFNQGPFFNGGRAPELLTRVFGTAVAVDIIDEVAALFEGLWERSPKIPEVSSTHADARSALIATLDTLEADIKKFSPEHGGIGHNRPPEDGLPITSEEQFSTLRAIEKMRLAVSSGSNHSDLNAAWHGISQITARLGSWALEQTNIFINGIVEEGGKAIGKKLPYLIGVGFAAWYHGGSIPPLLERLIDVLK